MLFVSLRGSVSPDATDSDHLTISGTMCVLGWQGEHNRQSQAHV